MAIPGFNKIDTNKDTKEVIQAKIDAMNKALENKEITVEEYEAEKQRVEEAFNDKNVLGYSFTWLKNK